MNYKTYQDLSNDIHKNLNKIYHLNVDLVVGIPRSGMIPAYMIALALNVHCIDLKSFIDNRPLKKGRTRKLKNDTGEINPHNYQNILLVDDTIASGNSLKQELELIPNELKNKITTFAVYSDRAKRDDIDIFLEYLSSPRVFQWNVYHHGILKDACVDIDGVLCVDPTEEQNDDGEKYIEFLLNEKPHMLLSGEIHSLVTNRLEKYRPQTEKWLKKYGIKYKNLVMLNLPSKEERQRLNANYTHKAEYYKKSKTSFFIESDISQAEVIHQKTGKPVYCADTNEMIDSNYIKTITKSPFFFLKATKRKISTMLPENIKSVLRPNYHLIKRIVKK